MFWIYPDVSCLLLSGHFNHTSSRPTANPSIQMGSVRLCRFQYAPLGAGSIVRHRNARATTTVRVRTSRRVGWARQYHQCRRTFMKYVGFYLADTSPYGIKACQPSTSVRCTGEALVVDTNFDQSFLRCCCRRSEIVSTATYKELARVQQS